MPRIDSAPKSGNKWSVSISDIPTDQLSKIDKIALMERLWEELAPDEPPAWHVDVLASRADEWERRHELGEDWDLVRLRLGSRQK